MTRHSRPASAAHSCIEESPTPSCPVRSMPRPSSWTRSTSPGTAPSATVTADASACRTALCTASEAIRCTMPARWGSRKISPLVSRSRRGPAPSNDVTSWSSARPRSRTGAGPPTARLASVAAWVSRSSWTRATAATAPGRSPRASRLAAAATEKAAPDSAGPRPSCSSRRSARRSAWRASAASARAVSSAVAAAASRTTAPMTGVRSPIASRVRRPIGSPPAGPVTTSSASSSASRENDTTGSGTSAAGAGPMWTEPSRSVVRSAAASARTPSSPVAISPTWAPRSATSRSGAPASP
ncbi:hypothetical protein CCO04_02165 [Pimelobacter sp. 30-1]|nr:hypothetical protein [Pimelobacter sp. 30-1]